MNVMEITVREAMPADVTSIAVLSTQLGYSTSEPSVGEIINLVASDDCAVILVAESDGVVAGWTQLVKQRLIIKDNQGTVTSFIVDDAHRGVGIGTSLLQASEKWFKDHGCASILVRSNAVRKQAHRFYLSRGYEHFKTSENFRKLFK